MKGIERFVSDPLGMEFVPMRKEVALTGIAAAGSALVGLGSTIFGGASSAAANRNARAISNGLYARDFAQNLRDYYQSPLERKGFRELLTSQMNYNKWAFQREKGAEAVSGGTPASTQQTKDSLNNAMAKTVASGAALQDAAQERAKSRQHESDIAHAKSEAQYEAQRGANIAQVASGLSNAVSQAAGAFAENPSLQGGSNMSTTRAADTSQSGVATPQQSNVSNNYVKGADGYLYDQNGNRVAGSV